jgi:hypothetical protein
MCKIRRRSEQYAEIKSQKGKCSIEANEDKIPEGGAQCRSVIEIDGNIENSTNARGKVRSLNNRPIKKIDGVDHLI